MVASRAENKVAFIDMGPLYRYYRTMYLTTQANYNQTVTQSVTNPNQWPFTFDVAPQQKPVVVTTLTVQQPTAVTTGLRTGTIFGVTRPYTLGLNTTLPLRQAYVASMDGTVCIYDVSRLNIPLSDPSVAAPKTVTVPTTPVGSFSAGRNPVSFLHTNGLSTSPDDLFVVSRVDRSVTFAFLNGVVQGVLRDNRVIDPVGGVVAYNQAGFGGSGPGKAVNVPVITLTDYDGRQLIDFGVDHLRRGSYNELYPFSDALGRPTMFLFGSPTPTPGKPFMMSWEEII